jgi:hypothetical protein
MKRWLPILAVLAGLGSFVSCKRRSPDAHVKPAVETLGPSIPAPKSPEPETVTIAAVTSAADQVDPFTGYLAVENAHGHQPARTRFAAECGIDLATAKANYAQRPGDTWNIVPNLSKAKDDLETDFYGTVAVLHQSVLILVERWGTELDAGDYYRLFFCLNKKQITLAESVSWRMAGFGESADDSTWGYEHRWKLAQSGRLDTSFTRYVDLDEKPMRAPKLDAETLKSLKEETMGMKTWADLEQPNRLLQ